MNRCYRVIRKDSPSGKTNYELYQVYYDERGMIQLISADPVSPHRETIEELREDLERMRQALELPVLPMEDVLDSLETSSASAYGRWIREQIADTSPEAVPAATVVSHEERARAEQRQRESIADAFAEKRRTDPYFDLKPESDDN